MNKIYEIQSVKKKLNVVSSKPIIINKNISNQLIMNPKTYNVSVTNFNNTPNNNDEKNIFIDKTVSDESYYDIDYELKNCSILYDVHDINEYSLFKLDIIYNHIRCSGVSFELNTYDLMIKDFKGISLTCHMDINYHSTLNKNFIIYSKNIQNKIITINNCKSFIISTDEYYAKFYPIYIRCCVFKMNTEQFIEIFPFLIQHIFD